jgi:hypothetical protein
MRSLFLLLAGLVGVAPSPAPESGLWLTRGYGYLLELEGDELRVFEHRALGDLPLATARRDAGGGELFLTADGEKLHLRARESDGALVADWLLTSHPLELIATDRSPRVPSEAERGAAPLNFEWFCASFAEHYAFFDERGVDWPAVTADARAKIGADTTDDELFDVLAGLVALLEDGHCRLEGNGRSAGSDRPDVDLAGSRRRTEARALVDEQYLGGRHVRACERRLTAGRLLDEVAYLRLDAMEGLDPSGGYWEGLEALDAALDNVFADFEGVTGLVIDVRFNGGGTDRYGFALAERLVSAPKLAVVKQVRSNPLDPRERSHVGEFRLEPSPRPGFRGPLVILVSRHTASAAEVFAMSLLGRADVTVIGEQSESVFSDIHSSQLPNGWGVALSNEVYLAESGECFEVVGVPLDVEIPTVRATDIDGAVDPALEAAVDALLQ